MTSSGPQEKQAVETALRPCHLDYSGSEPEVGATSNPPAATVPQATAGAKKATQ